LLLRSTFFIAPQTLFLVFLFSKWVKIIERGFAGVSREVKKKENKFYSCFNQTSYSFSHLIAHNNVSSTQSL